MDNIESQDAPKDIFVYLALTAALVSLVAWLLPQVGWAIALAGSLASIALGAFSLSSPSRSLAKTAIALGILGIVVNLINAQLDTSIDRQLFIQQIIIGLTIGSYLALIALGYTMVYGIIELINFAHGDLFAFGFFISLTIFLWIKPPEPMTGLWLIIVLPLVMLATMLITGTLNVTIDRVAYRRLRKAPRLAPLITAVGMSFMLEAIFAIWKGSRTVSYPDYFPSINILWDVIGLDPKDTFIFFTTKDLFLFGVTIPLMVGLTLFIDRTRTGKAMRAAAQDKEAAAMVGINVDRVIAITFFVGGALAGAAGMVWGLYINSGRFVMGFEAGLFAFTSAVLGGVGNIRGAVLGAFLIGMVRAMSDLYIGGEWSRVVIFAMLILFLVFRPSGLLGSTQGIEKV